MADFWSDFYNNLATDIAPIITLFGEQPTKQFLSESTSGWGAFTLTVLPRGSLTIVVSAIRATGSGMLMSFIGTAQEPEAAAEVELCSLTSDSVCELWSGRGVTRISGAPKFGVCLPLRTRGAQRMGHVDRTYLRDTADGGIPLQGD
ncbi:hypothetical protein MFIFM68171_09678 [Madurella fahalii]|uniref:Uncharacterized protein n=1 Tax=Madurella fahalii TaxID=1157608 RepID=A0ABQ0GP08_9PEZI